MCEMYHILLVWCALSRLLCRSGVEGCSPEMPFKAFPWRLGAPYRVGARYSYPQAILIDSRRLPEPDTRSTISA
nr:MAG TPA: hypothetical protein [Caudoviricetes sp.]